MAVDLLNQAPYRDQEKNHFHKINVNSIKEPKP